MIRRLKVKGFKSLGEVDVRFPQMTVLFGPNAAGKSNLLDAIQALSRVGTERTIADALADPIRGYPIESFAFPPGGLSALLSAESARFTLEADLFVAKEGFRYRVEIAIQPSSGGLSVTDEYLTALTADDEPRGAACIERVDDKLRVRRSGGRPREEALVRNHTALSDLRLGSTEYQHIEACRNDLVGWRVYYLDPRVAMRSSKPPSQVSDIGVLGENIAPFLYRLKAEAPKRFQEIRRTLNALIPSVEDVQVDIDERRGTLDILIRQSGTDFSSRIISEGTLRVLALCCIAANPWGGSLIAFEEPENGVHPRRVELMAQLLSSIAEEPGKQVIVTTHSPLFCEAVLKHGEKHPKEVALMSVHRGATGTEVRAFDVDSPLFRDHEIRAALSEATENGVFQGLVMRGLLDE